MTENNIIHDTDLDSVSEVNDKIDPGIIVFVPEREFDYSFWDSVANSGYDVFIVETDTEVIELLNSRPFETLYISTHDKNQFSSFANRLKEMYKLKSVIFFRSIKELLVIKSDTGNFTKKVDSTISIKQETNQNCHILMYDTQSEDPLMLKECLENLSFHMQTTSSIDSLSDIYHSHRPDILVIKALGTILEVSDLINSIEDQNISFEHITTYLITNSENLFELTGLLQKGIEDIFCIKNDLDPFLIKVIRTRNRLEEERQKKIKILQQIGTFGTLSNMNLIDLLQIMNDRGKTCVISITSQCHQLTIYTHNGTIVNATNNDIEGEHAIFSALPWKDGVWNIDQIDVTEFPEPNMNKSINSVLLEGCKHWDETQKIESTHEFNSNDPLDFLEE